MVSKRFLVFAMGLIIMNALVPSPGRTDVLRMEPFVLEQVLSETVPSAFSPNDMASEDFDVQWDGEPISEMTAEIIPGSLQWVRVHDVLVLPRGRLKIIANGIEGGMVQSAQFAQPFLIENNHQAEAQIPIVLLSGSKNWIQVKVKKNGQEVSGTLRLRFNPKTPSLRSEARDQRLLVDASCSPFGVTLDWVQEAYPSWVYVGCRMARVEAWSKEVPSLEIFLFWDDGLGSVVSLGKTQLSATGPNLWLLRLRSGGSEIPIEGSAGMLRLRYILPARLYQHGLSLGVGPYSFSFEGNSERLTTAVPLFTLYAGRFITESIRVVGFGAFAAEAHQYTDIGVYMYFENFRFLDRRLAINLLIGGHVIGFRSRDNYFMVGALPQGVEITYADAFARNRYLKLGAFIYPLIAGNAYYNLWLRWGHQIFAELNYIAWKAAPGDVPYSSSSVGLSVGFPVARF